MMIHHDQFPAFLFGLSELMKGRAGLRGQSRSTLAGSGKFSTWGMKPEPDKDVLTAFLQLLLSLLWCARLGGHLERWQMRARGAQSWQDHLKQDV